MAVTSLCAKLSSDKCPEKCVRGRSPPLVLSLFFVSFFTLYLICESDVRVCVCVRVLFCPFWQITKDPKHQTSNPPLVRCSMFDFPKNYVRPTLNHSPGLVPKYEEFHDPCGGRAVSARSWIVVLGPLGFRLQKSSRLAVA